VPFLTELANWCREVAPKVDEWPGWQTRGRSGGSSYSSGRPWCVMWHHTASSDQSLEDYHATQSDNAPVCNLDIKSDGTVVVIAAGPTNTNGNGQAMHTSKGTVPADSMNSYALGIEFYNNGVGQAWPQVQIDVGFAVVGNIQRHLGLQPSDLFTHHQYAPDRKVDPATAAAVQGPWQPRSCTSSGTWDLGDIRSECARRAGSAPDPGPGPSPGPSPTGEDMAVVIKGGDTDSYYAWNGVTITGIPGLNWVQAGFDNGLYKNTDPIVYSQAELDELLEQQSER
jgi:N-acetylmuramoyl-L-alanine amidase